MNIQLLIEILSFVAFSIFYILIRKIWLKKKLKNTNKAHEFVLYLFVLSIIFICYITIFPTFLMVDKKLYMTFKQKNYHHNNVPFQTINKIFYLLDKGIYLKYAYMNLLGNLFLFIPFTFLFYCLFKNVKVYQIILLAISISCFIELIQIPMQRISDIDDIILNSIGGLIGILLALLFKKIFPLKIKRLQNEM